MAWWCIKNSIAMICFTVLAIIFDHWWVALFGALFLSDYKETPVNKNKIEDKKENEHGTEHKND